MFQREHHRRIAYVLEQLDSELLRRHHCLFGGGTALALRYGEFRESVDLDFLVSDREGYRNPRQDDGGGCGHQVRDCAGGPGGPGISRT